MSDSSADRNPVERLAEEFAQRHRRGERPTLTEYVGRYPDLAGEIRELFPALLTLEQFKPDAGEATGPHAAAANKQPQRLGDYRILREVGRGGMGVVYEAEQLSLGRHVALKVLPPQALLNPTYLERFRREAKAAAKLHHTNIVPVYGVGEHNGTHFYAMQFIQGEGLNKVLSDLRRLRHLEHATEPALPPPAFPSESIARSLLGGRFADVMGEPAQVSRLPTVNATSPAPVGPSFTDTAPLSGVASSSGVLSSGGSGAAYYRSVARIGLQVAEALAYAHKQGILHRDITPSNLLLDLQGTVWITDFGLAKAEGADELTQTGDIVGTVRYMAPERFDGHSLPQSDIYSLGLTLYELLTLRPAFAETDRHRLIAQVMNAEPPRPRAVNPSVPRDLETIVRKASMREPGLRYQTAGELADDLTRFLDDRPIRARPAGVLERGWRWCRRNPRLALMTGALTALVLALAVGIPVGVVLDRQRQEALANLDRAEQAEAEVTHQLERAQEAERDAQFGSHLARARAYRYSGEVGQRFRSLAELAAAARLRPSLELRNEAVACLALADLRLTQSAELGVPGMTLLRFDAAFARCARSDERGNLSLRRVAADTEILTLPGPGTHAFFLEFSPDGRYLAAVYHQQPLHVWNLERGRLAWKMPTYTGGVAFSRDGRLAVAAPDDHTLDVRAVPTGRAVADLHPGTGIRGFAFDPTGDRLAVSTNQPRGVQLCELPTGKLLRTLTAPAPTTSGLLAWRPDGQLLAATGSDNLLYVWNTDTGRMQAVLRGHLSRPTELAFTPEGDLLVSSGWDNALRLWDPLTGRQLLQQPGTHTARQVPKDRRVGLGQVGTTAEVWEAARQEVCRTVAGPPDTGGIWGTGFSPDGRLLAFLCSTGTAHLWDWRGGREIVSWPVRGANSLHVHPDGSVLISGDFGLERWPVAIEPDRGSRLRVGPRQLLIPGRLGPACLSADGRILAAFNLGRSEVLLHDIREQKTRVLGQHAGGHHVALSPDATWVATAVWMGQAHPIKVRIWDARTGACVRSLGIAEVGGGDPQVAFTGDGRWLVTTTPREYRFWEVGSWQPGRTLALERGANRIVPLAAAGDGTMLAVARARSAVQLLDASGNELASLTCPEQQEIFGMRFSPDCRLLAVRCDNQIVHVWDLARLRRELAGLGLDWDLRAFGPEAPAGTPLPPEGQAALQAK
jgi:serine/threonine protein kinase/WD40 repeat protein